MNDYDEETEESKEKDQKEMSEPRTNGVTIMFNGQVMVSQEPIDKDHRFIGLVISKNREWVKDGMPLSNQGQ